jgi:hypothetical protein
MLRRVAIARRDLSEEHVASAIRVERIREWLVTANVVPNSMILLTLIVEVIRSFETSVLSKSHTVFFRTPLHSLHTTILVLVNIRLHNDVGLLREALCKQAL